MKKLYIYIITGICILAGISFFLPTESITTNDEQETANWDSLVTDAKKQKMAGDFSKQFQSNASLSDSKNIAKEVEGLADKEDAAVAQERQQLKLLYKSIDTYKPTLADILRKLSSKVLYQNLLYSDSALGKQELSVLHKNIKKIQEELTVIHKTLSNYQITANPKLNSDYVNTIVKTTSYKEYVDQIENFINQILTLEKTPEECLNFINVYHPPLVQGYSALQ